MTDNLLSLSRISNDRYTVVACQSNHKIEIRNRTAFSNNRYKNDVAEMAY
jgi:hypothetical protein